MLSLYYWKNYLRDWLPILPIVAFRERIGGKLEKKVAASVLGSRVAADDPASCQVFGFYRYLIFVIAQVCDCLPTREGKGYYLCYKVGINSLLHSCSPFKRFLMRKHL